MRPARIILIHTAYLINLSVIAKRVLLLAQFLLLLSVKLLYSQDVIFKTDGIEIRAKVIEITAEVVKYKNYDQLDEPLRNIYIKEIFMIIYEDGTREVFKNQEDADEIKAEDQNELNDSKEITITNTQPKSTIKTDSKSEFLFGGKGGWFIPTDEIVSDIYGSGFMWGLYASYWEYDYGITLELKSFSKEGDPYTFGSVSSASSHVSIIPLTVTLCYKFYELNPVMTYGGLGIGVAWITESIEMVTTTGLRASDEVSISKFEYHFTGGIQVRPLYFELTLSSINVDGVFGDTNFGGIILGFGLVF